MNLMSIIVGSVAGLAVGFFSGWLFVEFGWIPKQPTWIIATGAVLGGIFGGIAGSISGDMNRAAQTSNRFLVSMIFGALFGALGATKFGLLGSLLDAIHVPNPFGNTFGY
jgi:hypothetical protein